MDEESVRMLEVMELLEMVLWADVWDLMVYL